MHPTFKNHAHTLGAVFFLDVHDEDIHRYLNKKTVEAADAIVGKKEGL